MHSDRRHENNQLTPAERAQALFERAVKHRNAKNYPEAIKLCEEAITLSHAGAMHDRAYMYQYGQGGSVDYAKAIELFDKAIKRDNTSAMLNRGYMHENGMGGLVNNAEALRLYSLADNLGSRDGRRYIDAIKAKIIVNKLHNNLVDNNEKPENLPAALLALEQQEQELLKQERALLELIATPSSQRLLGFTNLLLNFPAKIRDLLSDPEKTGWLSQESEPKLQPIAQRLVAYLNRQKMKMEYLDSVREHLLQLKATLEEKANSWKIKNWLGQWVDGIPSHIKKISLTLAKMNPSDSESLLQSHAEILKLLTTIGKKKRRDSDTAVFYAETKTQLSKITFANPPRLVKLSSLPVEQPPVQNPVESPPSYARHTAIKQILAITQKPLSYTIIPTTELGHYPKVITGSSQLAAAAAAVDQPQQQYAVPNYPSICNTASDAVVATIPVAAEDQMAAAATLPPTYGVAAAPTNSQSQYDTQALRNKFPAVPNDPLPSVTGLSLFSQPQATTSKQSKPSRVALALSAAK